MTTELKTLRYQVTGPDVLTESYRAAQASAGGAAEVTVFSLLPVILHLRLRPLRTPSPRIGR